MKNYPFYESSVYTNVRQLIDDIDLKYSVDIAYSFRHHPLESEIEKITFRHLAHDVRCLTTALRARELEGKKIALIGKLSYGWVCTYLSVMAAGAVLVPLDPEWTVEDLADTMKKAECVALFCGIDTFRNKSEALISETGINFTVLTDGDENPVTLNTLILEGYERRNSGDSSYEDSAIDDDALSLLVFTSGTTGKGKGVMLSQKSVILDICSGLQLIEGSKKTIGTLPPHHTYGSTVSIIGHLIIGTEVYISSGLKYLPREIKEQKPGHLVLVPLYLDAFYRRILASAKESGKDKQLSRMVKLMGGLNKVGIDLRRAAFKSVLANFGGELRTVICGGAPLKQEVIDTFTGLGITIINGYGITECAPLVAVNRNKQTKNGSVGLPVPLNEIKIHEPDENGEGEILVKGDNVMMGYYKDEEATAAAFDEDGFFRTGDYGRIDSDGWLYITGRLKNLIILSNGKNVYPEEIEAALSEIPGIVDIVVYEGISRRGSDHNTIVAEIHPDADFLKKNAIEDKYAYFKQHINEYNKTAVPYKKVGLLKLRDTEFPKNTLRKITRFTLDKSID